MVMQATNVFIDSFDSEVKRAYQGKKSLRETVRVKSDIIGSTHRFPKAGAGVATEHNRGNDVVAMNASRDKVTVTLSDWDAFDYEDIMDINKLNFDDKKIIAENTADAMARREDQLIIDALEDEITNLSSASQIVGDGNSAPTIAYLAQTKRILDENNVPESDRYLVHSSYFLEDLLGITQVTSADYNMVKALVQGDVDTFMGFKFKMIGGRPEGGLPFSASDKRYNFVYHKQAVGLAIGKDVTPMVDWVPQKLAWQVGCVFSAGAVVIDIDGVVAIHTSEA
jgi:hypothetical protein